MDFVDFNLAKKLKNLGFNEPFLFFYREDDKDKCVHHAYVSKPLIYCDKVDDEVIIAPTVSQVLKWFREKKKIAVNVEFIPFVWQYKIIDMSVERRFEDCGKSFYTTYEEAALAGIEYVLDNLI
jgi:hypothetical protein